MSVICNQILAELSKYKLSDVKGSPYDNAMKLFRNPEDNNLVVIGTNGNASDMEKSNHDNITDRFKDEGYCHLRGHDWGGSRLRGELIRLPEVLNKCLPGNQFDINNMVLTNGLLLASERVAKIPQEFKKLKEQGSEFKNCKQLIKASMDFFNGCTLSLANPKAIFAYGNADGGHSAWQYINDYYGQAEKIVTLPINSSARSPSYKFRHVTIGGEEVPVIGSPHPSYPAHKLNEESIAGGLDELRGV